MKPAATRRAKPGRPAAPPGGVLSQFPDGGASAKGISPTASAGSEAGDATTDMIGLRVANLGLWLDARAAGLRLAVPASHAKFLLQKDEAGETTTVSGDLVLRVRNTPLPEARAGQASLCLSDAWELWLDEAGRYVFLAPWHSPPRRVVIDPGFTAGEVIGDFSAGNGQGMYPLEGLGIMLFVNWLAGFGDVILHAAGVEVDGQSYCFAGPPGAGKSTLAASLAANPSVTVLGEDQVILRYLDGRFWIYGTPWHVDPALCSPIGAPLKKLFFLRGRTGHRVEPVAPIDGVTWLLQTAFVPYYRPAAVAAILDRLALLAERTPFYTLDYQLGADVWKLISQA